MRRHVRIRGVGESVGRCNPCFLDHLEVVLFLKGSTMVLSCTPSSRDGVLGGGINKRRSKGLLYSCRQTLETPCGLEGHWRSAVFSDWLCDESYESINLTKD